MHNLVIQNILGALVFIGYCYLLRNNSHLYLYVIAFIVLYALYTLSTYRDYKLVKYIRLNHPKFYEKYKERIGLKFWLESLKDELTSLNDEYINSHTKNL